MPPYIPREDFLVLFQDVAASISSSLDLDETLALIVRRTAEVFRVWECDLFEYTPETGTMTGVAMWSREPTDADTEWVGSVVDIDQWPSYRPALANGMVVEDYVDDPELRRGVPGHHGRVGRDGRAHRPAALRRAHPRLPLL